MRKRSWLWHPAAVAVAIAIVAGPSLAYATPHTVYAAPASVHRPAPPHTLAGSMTSQHRAGSSVIRDRAGSSVTRDHAGSAWQRLPAGLPAVLRRDAPLAWTQQAEITATNGAAFDNFAIAVALSGDTALVGAYSAQRTGAAYVFVRHGATWLQTQELTARGGRSGDQFGQSVAISGSLALIGAPNRNNQAGAAYVFTRSGGAWAQQARLTAADGASFDFFGQSVALGRGEALVGAPGHNSLMGAVYVYKRVGASWSQTQEFTATDSATGDQFGYALSVHGAGLLVGAPYKNSQTGAAYIFTRGAGGYTQQAALTGSGAANGAFGFAVALGADTALVGEYQTGAGAVYDFTRSGSTWTRQAVLTASDGASGDLFGQAVALSGTTAMIGAPGRQNSTGAVYVFTRSGTTWTQRQTLTASDSAQVNIFGVTLALQSGTLLVGAPGHASFTGAAYDFTRS